MVMFTNMLHLLLDFIVIFVSSFTKIRQHFCFRVDESWKMSSSEAKKAHLMTSTPRQEKIGTMVMERILTGQWLY